MTICNPTQGFHSIEGNAVAGPVTAAIYNNSNGSSNVVTSLPAEACWNWNKSFLSARMAYQVGEVETAVNILERTIEVIGGWLPTNLTFFVRLLFKARKAFYTGDFVLADTLYGCAQEMLCEFRMEAAFASIAAELFDEWGDCLVMQGSTLNGQTLKERALAVDLTCFELSARQMTPWRLAKLARYFVERGLSSQCEKCLTLAEQKTSSPVEKMFVRGYCA